MSSRTPYRLSPMELSARESMARRDPFVDTTVPAEAPADPALRAKWMEAVGTEPKAHADMRRDGAAGREGSFDEHGQWVPDAQHDTLRLVRDGRGTPDDGEENAVAAEEAERAFDHSMQDPADNPGEVPYTASARHPTDPAPPIDEGLPPLPKTVAAGMLKPRWESFCRLYAYGNSAADAARQAGYAWTSAPQTGWRLLQDERIRTRVRELQSHLYRSEAWDNTAFVTRLEAAYREAMHRGQYGAAVRAVEAAARLERREGDTPDPARPPAERAARPDGRASLRNDED